MLQRKTGIIIWEGEGEGGRATTLLPVRRSELLSPPQKYCTIQHQELNLNAFKIKMLNLKHHISSDHNILLSKF